MTEGQRVIIIRNLRVRRRELVHVERKFLLGAVARRRNAREIVGRLDCLEEERGAQHGCYGLRDGVEGLSRYLARCVFSRHVGEIYGSSSAAEKRSRDEVASQGARSTCAAPEMLRAREHSAPGVKNFRLPANPRSQAS